MAFAIIFLILAVTHFSQAANNFTDGQTINMVLSPEAFNGTVYLRGNITEGSTVKIVLDRGSAGPTGFVIFQVHSYAYPVSLSYRPTFLSGDSVNGTDIGLYSPLNTTQLTFFIRNSNPGLVDVILIPVAYKNDKPIPGACNLSFAVNVAPYMTLTFNDSEIFQVDAQPAAKAGHADICKPSTLQYEVYELNIQTTSADAYFSGILSVVTVSGAVKNGKLTRKPMSQQPLLRRRFANYLGFGKILVASVTDEETGASSAYVPVTSYDNVRANRTDIFSHRYAAIFTMSMWLVTSALFGFCNCCNEKSLVSVRLIPAIISIIQLSSVALNCNMDILNAATAIGIFLWGLVMIRKLYFLTQWIVPVLFPLCSAQLAFGLAIRCGLGTVEGFEGSVLIWIVFTTFYVWMLIFEGMQKRYSTNLLSHIIVATYAVLAIISQVAYGALIYLWIDSLRILKPTASDAIFSNSDGKGDVLLLLWPVSVAVVYGLSKFIRPEISYSEL